MSKDSPNPDTMALPLSNSSPVTTVVHVITGLKSAGAENSLFRLVSGTDPRYFRHVIVSLSGEDVLGHQLQARGFEVHTLKIAYSNATGWLRTALSLIKGFTKLVKILRRVQPRILHCWLYHSNVLGFFAGKIARVPHIVFAIRSSDLNFSEFRAATRWTMKIGAWLSPFIDCVVFNSAAGRKVNEEWGYDPSRGIVIFNGFDLQAFQPDAEARSLVRRELGVPEQCVLIGIIARLDPLKDYPVFLQAAELLLATRPETHFLLAGLDVTAENPVFSAAAARDLFHGKLHLLGYRQDVARLYAALDILCSSSCTEGVSNSIGEAMSCGTPCVVTDVGDSAFVVGDTGLVVPPKNPAALAEVLRKMIDLPAAERREMGARARQRIADNFAIDTFVSNHQSLYFKLCHRIPAGPGLPAEAPSHTP